MSLPVLRRFLGYIFLVAAGIAWVIRGNMMAALLATFVGNPITFPFIAAISMELGTWVRGRAPVPLPEVVSAFSDGALKFWQNLMAMFTTAPTNWGNLAGFFDTFFLTYLVGGILPGFASAIAFYILSTPVLNAYQKARVTRLKRRFAKKREKVEKMRASQLSASTISSDKTAAE